MSIRVLLGTSLLLLTLSAVFGFLNTSKVRALRTEQADALAARAIAENARIAQRKQPPVSEARSTTPNAKVAETQARVAKAETEAAKAQEDKAAALQKLQATENQLTQLQKQVQQLGPASTESFATGGPSVAELQAQLDETRRQLDNAEREKSLVAEKTQSAEGPSPKAVEERVQSRRLTSEPGLHGTIWR